MRISDLRFCTLGITQQTVHLCCQFDAMLLLSPQLPLRQLLRLPQVRYTVQKIDTPTSLEARFQAAERLDCRAGWPSSPHSKRAVVEVQAVLLAYSTWAGACLLTRVEVAGAFVRSKKCVANRLLLALELDNPSLSL